jgi:hypothetical protein
LTNILTQLKKDHFTTMREGDTYLQSGLRFFILSIAHIELVQEERPDLHSIINILNSLCSPL